MNDGNENPSGFVVVVVDGEGGGGDNELSVSVDVDDDIDNTKPAATQPNVVHSVGDAIVDSTNNDADMEEEDDNNIEQRE